MSRIEATVELPTKVAYIKPTLHKKVRMIAAERGQRINEVMEELLCAGLSAVDPDRQPGPPSAN